MTLFFLVRHGETDWNREGKYTGQSDIPLNDFGRWQAGQAAEQLKLVKPDVIISSDLMRALETARIIAGVTDAPVMMDKRLREIHQGEWEGLHVNEIKARFNGLFNARNNNPLNVSAPNGESIGQVHTRVLDAAKDICIRYPREKVVISAHGVVLAILRLTAKHQPLRRVFEFIPENAVIHQVELEEEDL